jgi:hypothetical protein
MGQVAGTLSQMGSVAAGAKLAGKGLSKTFSTIKKLIPQKSSEAKNLKTQEVNEMKMKSFKDTGKHFKTAETVEKQSKNPNDPDSRFDGTKSGKNVYQKATPGQPITEDNLKGDSMAALADRAKILDQLAQDRQNAIQAAQAPKTSTSQASERRQFGPEGEVVTTVGPRGEKTNALIPNMAAKKQPPKMVNALTQQKAPNTLSVVKNVVRESYVCDNCDCGLHEEILNERGADSKGYFRSTESGAGLTAKGAKHFGVQTAVTEPNPTGKRAARRRSFCARMSGMKGPMKDEKGRPTRKAMSLRRWNCH